MWQPPIKRVRGAYLFLLALTILLLGTPFGPSRFISPENKITLDTLRVTYQDATAKLVGHLEKTVPLLHHHNHAAGHTPGLCKGMPCSKVMAMPLRYIDSQKPLFDDESCLEAWVAQGQVCPSLDFSAKSKIDAVWTWVNGSEARHGALRHAYMAAMQSADPPATLAAAPEKDADDVDTLLEEDSLTPDIKPQVARTGTASLVDEVTQNYGTADSRFRDNTELLFAIRSVYKHLGDSLGNMHVISPDFPDQEEYRTEEGASTTFTAEGGRRRLGQIPSWLDPEHIEVKTGESARRQESGRTASKNLFLHHNWDTFVPVLAPDAHIAGQHASVAQSQAQTPLDRWSEKKMHAWKSKVVPNFNSIAIESTMGSDTGMADAYYYANDDMYLGRDISAADMISPLFGPSLLIRKSKMVAPWRDAPFNLGYNAELYYSNALLSDRFGSRSRPYVSHTQKIVSQPLTDEMKLMFHNEVGDLRRFRAMGPDINFAFMLYHTIIERHREALLWSFFVARSDEDGDGVFTAAETSRLVRDLGLDVNIVAGKDVSRVYHPIRDAWKEQEMNKALVAARHPAIKITTIRFSAMVSGYASAKLFNVGPISWPNFSKTTKEGEKRKHACDMAAVCVEKVLRGDATSESLFTLFAFEQPDCGDCAITQLLGKSGRKGYGAFLPSGEASMPDTLSGDVEEFWESSRQERVAHLPLTARWNESDFSLAGVAAASGRGGTRRRSFAMQLIQRYQYSVSYSPQILGLLKDEVSTEAFFEEFASSEMTWICINDEIDDGVSPAATTHIYDQVADLLKTLFPDPLPFEKINGGGDDDDDNYNDTSNGLDDIDITL